MSKPVKALFLDRDGVVNLLVKKFSPPHKKIIDDSPFKVEELKFNEGILELVQDARKKGYKVLIATNQPSVLRGQFSLKDYEDITTKICQYLSMERSEVFQCFHREGFSLPCICRKPAPGMVLMAKGLFNLDLSKSIIIGDSPMDIELGKNTGLKTIFLRRKENEFQFGNAIYEREMKERGIHPDYKIDSLNQAISLL